MADVDLRRARVFGTYAEEYARFRPTYPEAAVAWLLPAGAEQVVDLGAGTGKLTSVLLGLGVQVAAVEPDAAMLAVLRRDCPEARAYEAGAEALPLPDASVDAMTAGQAWHWFPHEATVAEVRRVLRPGGWLGLIWNGPDPVDDWERQLARLDPDTKDWDPDDEDDRLDVPGLPADELELAEFPWTWEITGASLTGRLLTHSAFILMEPAERDELVAEMAAVVDTEADRRRTTSVPLRQRALCVRWRP